MLKKLKQLLGLSAKYYIVIGYRGHELADKHTTVIYLGDRNNKEYNEIYRKFHSFIDLNPMLFKPKSVFFKNREMFGVDKDVPVLLPTTNDKAIFFNGLRNALSAYNASAFSAYRPHVSTSDSRFMGTMNRLCICTGNYKVISEHNFEN